MNYYFLFLRKESIFYFFIFFSSILSAQNQEKDSFLWLENSKSLKTKSWVKKQNKYSLAKLDSSIIFNEIYDSFTDFYNEKEEFVHPIFFNDFLYDFEQSLDHPRGVWRRAPKSEYGKKKSEIQWDILLDIDKLSLSEKVDWYFAGVDPLYPLCERFLVMLSNKGGDATTIREYDVNTKTFVKNGFYLPKSKSSAIWVDENTLFVALSLEENTATTSGYPRQIRKWKRGTPIENAPIVYEIPKDFLECSIERDLNDLDAHTYYIYVYKNYYESQIFILQKEESLKELLLPTNVVFQGAARNKQVVLKLAKDWEKGGKIYKQGALLSANIDSLLLGNYTLYEMFTPEEKIHLSEEIIQTKDRVVLTFLNNISSEIVSLEYKDGKWIKHFLDAPKGGSIYLVPEDENSNDFYFYYNNFIQQDIIYKANALTLYVELLQTTNSYFDTSNLVVEQLEVKSKDGTLVPYFLIRQKDMPFDGTTPTILSGYGAFEVAITPEYDPFLGLAWLSKGGAYAIANIRGGNEFGYAWHQAALKEKRQNSYDDFYAVAEDLINKKITSPQHLGIEGSSNGGLLTGVAFTQRPDLFRAVYCGVPLLDMKRYHLLLAGASWLSEYGNPDIPEEWEYLKKYSPYHNLKAGMVYPDVFFATSSADDRVHPGHARKMAAKMQSLGYKIYYYESISGGHATDDEIITLMYSFFWEKLK